jgi:cerevisin
MRIFSALSSLLLAGAAVAQSSDCSPKSSDVQTVQFAWALQSLSERFWTAQSLNQTFLSSAPNASNANYDANFKGITRENRLGVRAVQQVGNDVPGFSAPRCNFSIPAAQNAQSFTRNALRLEQTVAGALIGLSAYTQAPEVSFLLARLAAEHSAHAAYIGNEQNSTYFPSNSSSLIPAYTPDQVLRSGNQTGQLGTYLQNCVSAPAAPCGQKVNIGPLVASFNSTGGGAGGASSSATPSSSAASGSATATTTARHRKYY